MQNLYNLIQREEEREMNQLCQEQGVGLIPYSPLARGFLAGNRSKEGGGATERAKNDTIVAAGTYRDCDWEVVDRLKKIALGKNCTPAQAALAWMLSKPYMIVGQPYRLRALREALQHIANHPQKDKVWFTRPGAIYDHCAALPKGTMVPPPA